MKYLGVLNAVERTRKYLYIFYNTPNLNIDNANIYDFGEFLEFLTEKQNTVINKNIGSKLNRRDRFCGIIIRRRNCLGRLPY